MFVLLKPHNYIWNQAATMKTQIFTDRQRTAQLKFSCVNLLQESESEVFPSGWCTRKWKRTLKWTSGTEIGSVWTGPGPRLVVFIPPSVDGFLSSFFGCFTFVPSLFLSKRLNHVIVHEQILLISWCLCFIDRDSEGLFILRSMQCGGVGDFNAECQMIWDCVMFRVYGSVCQRPICGRWTRANLKELRRLNKCSVFCLSPCTSENLREPQRTFREPQRTSSFLCALELRSFESQELWISGVLRLRGSKALKLQSSEAC